MRIGSFFVCDDIRFEVGNKISLIGLYDDRIVFHTTPDKKNLWPKHMKIGFFSKIILDNDSAKTFKFKTVFNGKEQMVGEGPLKEGSKRITLAFVINPFIFEGVGVMQFQYEFYNAQNNLVEKLIPESSFEIQEIAN